MNITSSCEPSLEADVAEFLDRRAAKEEYQTTCEVVRTCFPELRDIQVYLQEDPDEEERWRVIIQITLPPIHSLDLLAVQRRRFADQLVERLPPMNFPDPVCSLLIRFAPE